ENRWRLYIRAIRFPLGNEMGLSNSFTSITKTETEVESVVSLIIDEKEAKEREKATQVQKLIFEGDNFFDDAKYDNALIKYREARLVDFNAKQPKEKITVAQNKINELKDQARKEAERKLKIEELKSGVKLQYANYNFDMAKSLCDSLTQDYGVKDPEMDKLNDQLTEINASLAGIESAMDKKDWKNAIKQCELKIKEAKDSISKAEYNYRLTTVYFESDISEQKKIFEYSTNAIEYSAKQHQRALMLRAQMYLFTNQIANAIVDATRLINNDPRNPDNYVFRAGIYEKDKINDKAIDDYGKAINLKTKDMSAYLKKARLEFELKKYVETQKTTTDGLGKYPCFGPLFFYRGMAFEKLKDFEKAGTDFRSAGFCNVGSVELKIIDSISFAYVKSGDLIFKPGSYKVAEAEYSKAIAIDSSRIGLFKRGLCFYYMEQYQKAYIDFDALSLLDPKFKDVHYQKGLALSKLNKYEEAILSIDKEILNFSPTADIYLQKGKCEMALNKYENAALSFDKSGSLLFKDSVYYLASLAYFNAGKFKNCVDMSLKARSNKSKMYEVYFLCGKAWFEQKNYDEAIKEYEKAMTLKVYNEDLFYCYANTLYAKRNFNDASSAYSRLSESTLLKDTTLFLSSICLIKTKNSENILNAVKNLDKYLIQANPTKKEIVFSWLAYCYLHIDSPAQANDQIENAIKIDPENAVLNLALACRASKSGAYEEAARFLDKALKSGQFDKEDIEGEKMFKGFNKAPSYKNLIAQYYQVK
ncbi:MAG TPA: tetratricopeptide repeat protein, partial [Bacteroidia bacterium]|nr:tetratricopeptide repeat protein [Bacteroidia bacterium]